MRAPGQVSWLSDRPTPHAFPARLDPSQWLIVGFVPDYSDGVAADSHRLPWGPHPAGHPDTVNALTVTERRARVKRGREASGASAAAERIGVALEPAEQRQGGRLSQPTERGHLDRLGELPHLP